MKIRLPLMIQDPSAKAFGKIGLEKWHEGFHPDREDFYLDGPVSKRLAVIDFSPKHGMVQIDAKFRPPGAGHKMGWYENPDGDHLHKPEDRHMFTPAFLQVSSFALVLRTMYMFERKETLGRELTWAFGAPQLLIIPRAGETANAFYHRDSHSLQFFYVTRDRGDKPMYTCLSRDIVAHETGHAIVDSIAPDLLDACTPQSLAIHEAIADLTASLMAFESHTLREHLLKEYEGSIENSTHFSTIGEEFGELLGQKYGLRNLNNKKNLDPNDEKNCVSRTEPHSLSQVLSGSLYRVLISIYDGLKKQYMREERRRLRADTISPWEVLDDAAKKREVSLSGYTLAKATERFQRMIFRALDYLPPGEASFADYGRAMIAVDRVAYGRDKKMRNWIRKQYLKRSIIQSKDALDIETKWEFNGLRKMDLKKLLSSDYIAYWFANRYRKFLFIPKEIEFEVHPRLLLEKKYAGRIGHELLFKVSWEVEEEHESGSRNPNRILFPVGTTLAINWETKEILARLTNAPPDQVERGDMDSHSAREYEEQRADRDIFIKQLAEQGILKRNAEALDPKGRPLLSAIHAQVTDGRMRVRGAGKLFHIIR